jgi:2-oxoglutarate dehydrogenase E1 component
MALAYAVQHAARTIQHAPALLRLRHFHTSTGIWQEPKHPEPVQLSKLKDSFNDGTSITYLEELERRFQNDPGSVDRSWASFFNSLGRTHVQAQQVV